ncbi:MAG TPA: hypothetical protein VFT54_03590 [Acidimicrobiia bacterium]|nr:hypothetical protein [Acidimicrobiia bacterium]
MTNNDDEQFERIPWDQLRPTTGGRRGLIYALAAAIVAAAVSATLARNLAGPPPTTLPLAPTPTAAQPLTTTSLVPTVTTESATVWSEADLMAVHPDDLRAEAAAIAEWFVADYFTADGSGGLEDQLRSMLPSEAPLPVHEPGYRSFVEWVRSVSAIEESPGQYLVQVVVRTLGALESSSYRRLPLRAVEVNVQWTDQGWSIADLPSPIDLPALAVTSAWPEQEIPEQVAAEAIRVGGEGATVLGGGRSGERWRVVVETVDPAGGRWPMVIWVDDRPPTG